MCCDIDIPCCEEALQQLGWQHQMLLCTDQFVLCIDVNDGTQSAGIQLAVSDLTLDTSLQFTDTGVLFGLSNCTGALAHCCCYVELFYVVTCLLT